VNATPERKVGGHEDLVRILEDSRTIAVVGASRDPNKAAHAIPAYLVDQGYNTLPVNPNATAIFGKPAYRSLADVDAPIDVVDVFRPPQEAEDVARQAVATGAKVLWFQPGTHTEEAVAIAHDAGLIVVTGRCIGVTHAELGIQSRRPDL
jgi:predicted CoA-binding protein